MDYGEYELDLSDAQHRPFKRPRSLKDGDDGHRPYIPLSASLGAQPDVDGGPETIAKKGGRKRPLSCGECRRLKLKCDRVFPCQSCRKRGCAEICPDGALTGGKGSRFILANTEQLHDKIKTMSERIRVLEEGLHSAYSQVATGDHPLLRQDLLTIKKSPELFGIDQRPTIEHDATPEAAQKPVDIPRAPSSVSSRDEDEVGATAADPTSIDLSLQQQAVRSGAATGGDVPSFPDDLTQLSRSFPSPWSISFELDLNMRQRIRDYLPSREEAQHLCEQAQRNAFWQFHPDSSETFLPNLIHSVYTTPLSALMPHRLALLLMILAIGAVVDARGSDKQLAEKYHHLARAALCEVPVMDDTSIDAVNALFFMVWYLLTFSDHKKAMEYAWGVLGLAVKLSHSIALHRDGVRSKVIPEELDKRRSLFWNLMRSDVRLALLLRRPPSISMRHVDAKQPVVSEDDKSVVSEYVSWQNNFLVQCTMPVMELVMSAQPVPYSDVLGLDRSVRNYEIPLSLQMVDTDGPSPEHPLGMQQALLACSRHIALLHLHRSYFTLALTGSEDFTVQHTYAPSVLAVYSGCCSLISTIHTVYTWEPELSTCYSIFWANCFSAACALCFLVSRAPSLPIAPNALQELDRVSHLFMKVRDRCPRVASYFAVLHKLIARSREHYVNWRSGTQVFQDEMTDEICILVRKITPAAANTEHAPNVAAGDPFEHAHPFLRRCLEQATAEDPCLASGFHLTRIRGFVGTSIAHPESDVRSYSATGESSRAGSTAPGQNSAWSNGRSRAGSIASASLMPSSGGLGSDIADSCWMTWL